MTRNGAVDIITVPLVVVVHVAVVFVLVCLYLYELAYLTYVPRIADDHVPRSIELFLILGMPFCLSGALAWLDWRFILGKIVRTDTARDIGGTALTLVAFAIPLLVLMPPVSIVIGCAATSERVGKSICI
jgi:hypothetical protein